MLRQFYGQFIHLPLGRTIDDPWLVGVGRDKVKRLRQPIYPRLHGQEQILPIKAGNKGLIGSYAQQILDIRLHPRRGGCGQSHTGCLAKTFVYHA